MEKPATRKRIGPAASALVFGAATAWFFLLTAFFAPWIRGAVKANGALHWFLLGYLLFSPLAVAAYLFAQTEGARGIAAVAAALDLKKPTPRDLEVSFGVLVACFVLTGLLYVASAAARARWGLPPAALTPPFMEFEPFRGAEFLLFLAWIPMFALNILGEEALWRGCLLSRTPGGDLGASLLNSLLWIGFHAPFGVDLMAMLVPIALLLPFAVRKTRNATVGVIVHGLYNGPVFILIASGVVG